MPTQASLSSFECSVYFESIRLIDIDTRGKFKSALDEFEQNAEAEYVAYSTASFIDSFETDDGTAIEAKISNNGELIPVANEGEIAFFFYYLYTTSSYCISINMAEELVSCETKQFSH